MQCVVWWCSPPKTALSGACSQILRVCLGTGPVLGECPEQGGDEGQVNPSVVAGWYKERGLPEGKHKRVSSQSVETRDALSGQVVGPQPQSVVCYFTTSHVASAELCILHVAGTVCR